MKKEIQMGSIEYHLRELGIALDKDNDKRILPAIFDSDKAILDLGCGIGQTLIALACCERKCVGIDCDEGAIKYGIEKFGNKIQLIWSCAEKIPLPSKTFNLVYSRGSLPYMNIPIVIKEIRRVLVKNGRIWLTLHDRERIDDWFKECIKKRNIKKIAYLVYTLLNGYLLKYFRFVLPNIDGKYSSWQDPPSIKKQLLKAGYEVNIQKVGRHFVVEGYLK
jgi:ubiquinone/menaquinone biosynthesis C-methylase UbiE